MAPTQLGTSSELCYSWSVRPGVLVVCNMSALRLMTGCRVGCFALGQGPCMDFALRTRGPLDRVTAVAVALP
eukprot:656167-Lingulodinium_polyedra.AAC.1